MYKKKVCFIILSLFLMYQSLKSFWKLLEKAVMERDKNYLYYMLCAQWLTLKRTHDNIGITLRNDGIRKVAIYGKGMLGELLFDELTDIGLHVVCFLDQQTAGLQKQMCKVPVITLDDIGQIEPFDAIVVTPCYFYRQIEADLKYAGIKKKLISLETLLYKEKI